MAVVVQKLTDDLITLYEDMAEEPMDPETFADKMSKIISKQMLTAAVPAGSVLVGADAGVPNPAEIKVV